MLSYMQAKYSPSAECTTYKEPDTSKKLPLKRYDYSLAYRRLQCPVHGDKIGLWNARLNTFTNKDI